MTAWLQRHQRSVNQLLDLLLADRLPHALLFRGPAGVGKREVARRFCMEALARTARAQDMFGGASSEPVNFEREHPDLIWIAPEDGTIKVERVRDLAKNLSYAPLESEHRFVVLVEAECLNVQAANAILKILEEPPAHTHFILTARDRSLVIPTIASRCQDVRFKPLTDIEMQELAGTDKNLVASEGSLQRKDDLSKWQEAQLWEEPARLLLRLWEARRIPAEVFGLLERLDGEADALAVLESWQALGRDIGLRLSLGVPMERWYHGHLAPECEAWLGTLVDVERQAYRQRLGTVAAVCDQARAQIRANVNSRLALESVLAQFAIIA